MRKRTAYMSEYMRQYRHRRRVARGLGFPTVGELTRRLAELERQRDAAFRSAGHWVAKGHAARATERARKAARLGREADDLRRRIIAVEARPTTAEQRRAIAGLQAYQERLAQANDRTPGRRRRSRGEG